LLLPALLCACSPDAAPDGPPGLVRLIDSLQPGSLQLPFDPRDRAAVVESASDLIFTLGADALADEHTSVAHREAMLEVFPQLPARNGLLELSGPDDSPRLHVRGPIALTRMLAVTDPRPLLVRVEIEGGHYVGLIPNRRGETLPEIDDIQALHGLSKFEGLPLIPTAEPDDSWVQVVVPADPERSGLLMVILAVNGSSHFGRTEVRAVTPLAEALLLPGLRPDADHISLDGEAREAFILPDGGSTTWTLEHVPDALQLTVDLAALGPPGKAIISFVAQSEGLVDVRGRWVVPRKGGPWHPFQVQLPAFGGRALKLTLRAELARGAIVVGRPTLTRRAADTQPMAPNVIIVSLDTLRADRVAPGVAATPRLQALAAESLQFSDASSVSAWTLPAHASLFTSRWSQAHGVTDRYRKLVGTHAETLAQAFRAAGYETAAITGGGYLSPTFGLAAGFERYDIHDPCLFAIDRKTKAAIQPHGSRAKLLALLSGRRDRPLFVFVHTFAAHHGLPVNAKLDRVGMQREDFQRIRAQVLSILASKDTSAVLDAQLVDDVNAIYDASVMAADDLVGDIVDTLRAAGTYDNTILVVTSDHGQELLDRTTVGHGHQMHPELLRIPLLVRAPGSVHGTTDAPVSLVDLAPTLRELAGLERDPDAHGRSLVPLLSGKPLRPAPILSHLANSIRQPTHVYRRGNLTLHLQEDNEGLGFATALYDLSADPQERDDMLSRQPVLAAEMAAEFNLALPVLKAMSQMQAGDVELDAETRRQLEELGYLTGG
jgi:hypothetical protein